MTNPLFTLPPDERVPQRILDKIDKKPSGCWEWTAYKSEDGYGVTYADRKIKKAHRVLYELLVGPIPAGLEIDHLCRNPSCVNPEHLEPVTHRENMLRGTTPSANNAKKTHCPKGHPYDDQNTYWYRGGRYCRACKWKHPTLIEIPPRFTERQLAALSLLPATDVQVGAELHRRRGCCQGTCKYVGDSGREVLHAIRKKAPGVIVRRRDSGVWERLDGRGSQGEDIGF